MKISVIMPVYNSEKYLEGAIASVLSQKGAELEIIAVDDCSKDGSALLLRRLAESDARIKPIFNEKNLGVAEVRNIAISKATGDFLAFCDSDDTVPEGAYEALLSVIGDRDVAIGTHVDKSDSGTLREAMLTKEEKSSLFRAVFSVSCLWTKLIRRSFVAENSLSFDTDMRIGEDVVFLAELVTKNPSFAVTDECVYYHLHHASANPSLTHIYDVEAFKVHIECRYRLLEICREIPECRDFVYRYFSYFLVDMLPKILAPEEREEAFSLFKKYMLEYDFSKERNLLRAIVGVPYETFVSASADEYFDAKGSVLAREQVLWEFQSGRIGLRWAVKYIFSWFGYKIKKIFGRKEG